MSTLTAFLRKQQHRWYRRDIAKTHGLRRHLAYFVARHGFQIGDYSYGAPIVRQWDQGTKLMVGRYCSIAPDVEFILGGNHRAHCVTTFPISGIFATGQDSDELWSRGDIVVGSDVWIGAGAVIMSGVRIGDGAVVGAHAVITRDVEPFAIVAGNPARLIRQRFPDDIIQQLLELRWWDLNHDQLMPFVPLLRSDRIQDFVAAIRNARPYAGASERVLPSAAFVPRIHPAART